MRLPWIRMTTRRWMIAVAVVAVAVFATVIVRRNAERSRAFRLRAAYHADAAADGVRLVTEDDVSVPVLCDFSESCPCDLPSQPSVVVVLTPRQVTA
jgi:hypothetical protein